MKVSLVRCTDEPEQMIARAARISHMASSEGKEDDRDLIRRLRNWGHWSPFEFVSATFFIEEVSRSCLAQLTRHRLGSFMVRSMRYVKQEPDEVVVPNSVQEADYSQEFKKQVVSNYESYQEMLDAGVPKEDARFILPIGSKTSLYFKTNFREYRHIIDIRDTEAAQWEIRQLAEEFLEQLSEIAPSVFEDQIE